MSHTLLPPLLLLLLPFFLGDEGDVALSSVAQGSHRALPMGVAGPMIGLPSRSCSTASSEVESEDELEDGEEEDEEEDGTEAEGEESWTLLPWGRLHKRSFHP